MFLPEILRLIPKYNQRVNFNGILLSIAKFPSLKFWQFASPLTVDERNYFEPRQQKTLSNLRVFARLIGEMMSQCPLFCVYPESFFRRGKNRLRFFAVS